MSDDQRDPHSKVGWLTDAAHLPTTPTDTGALSSTAVADSAASGGCQQAAGAMREARRLIERLAIADIDISGTAAIGITSTDIIAAGEWLDCNLTDDGGEA